MSICHRALPRASSRQFVRVVGALIALLVAVVLTQALLASDAPEPNARVLHPGDNLVGWVGAETTSKSLFEQLPAAILIYAWDAKRSRYLFSSPRFAGSLDVIQPGMGLVVRIDANQPLTWRQPSTAVSHRVDLQPGPNLVAWTSASRTPINLALGTIDDADSSAIY